MALRKIAFLLEDFVPGAPSQQLLDRFLIGFARDGAFQSRPGGEVGVWLPPAANHSTPVVGAVNTLAIRRRDFKLVQYATLEAALKGADGVVVIPAADRVGPASDLIDRVIQQCPSNTACFIYGCVAPNFIDAARLVAVAAQRNVAIASASSVATTFRLPEVDVPTNSAISEALIVVQGSNAMAALAGIDGLAPILSRGAGPGAAIRSVRFLEGRKLWSAGEDGVWLKSLLAAAIARSNTTQGDAVRDGRTQDLVGLGLVKKLARHPRGWIIGQQNGVRAAILLLDGVVADINFAVRSRDGTITSAQLYRPPAPQRAEFDRLAGVIEDFLTTRTAPWPKEQMLLVAQFMEAVTIDRR